MAPGVRVQAFSTYMYTSYQTGGFEAVANLTARSDIWKADFLVIPIHDIDHWIVVVVVNPAGLFKARGDTIIPQVISVHFARPFLMLPFGRCVIISMDSLNFSRDTFRQSIATWLEHQAFKEHLTIKNPPHSTSLAVCSYLKYLPILVLATDEILFDVVLLQVPEQRNGVDCGPYMVHNLDRFMRNRSQLISHALVSISYLVTGHPTLTLAREMIF